MRSRTFRGDEVEKYIAKLGVRATLLAPVYFMENLYFGKEQLTKGIYATPLAPTRPLAQVAVADIGAVAVRVLEDSGWFSESHPCDPVCKYLRDRECTSHRVEPRRWAIAPRLSGQQRASLCVEASLSARWTE